ncbi:hypothetical protein [Solidesulfovibrio magneticus]|uniref:Uncharacterized protein n=1 Tax=Solidesulfovibrio magneticus (strain ATCC 700980 / DSM 13731 / RS-1) TaxID=573370 RepID=C4XJ10_SOLM1|nr:hypothetical protein [Solidesulfovibrio magneticus]BAH74174.1 hypothetical protein DMR_06830 [Solidesulfovibrio magneticus RS-1]
MVFRKGPLGRDVKLRGSVLFVVIGAIVVMSVIGAAMSRLQGAGTGTEVQENRIDDAYYAAISGINYVAARITSAMNDPEASGWNLLSLNGTYTINAGQQFELAITKGSGTDYNIQSRGIMLTSGSSKQTNCILKTTKTYSWVPPTPPETPPNLGSYNFVNPSNRPNYAAYAADDKRTYPTGTDTGDIITRNIVVGKDYYYGFGNVWFAGTNTGYSVDGVSSFGKGIRMFLTFKFLTTVGDGFTVAILNGSQNNYLSSGGDSAEGGLLGYAGDSRVYNSNDGGFASTILEYVDKSGYAKGLNPPKFAVEIDTYTNKSDDSKWNPSAKKASCTDDNAFMNDLTYGSKKHHVGIMYWGDDTAYLRKTCPGPGDGFKGNVKRYTDVRHGSEDNAPNSPNSQMQYIDDFVVGRTYFLRMDVLKSGATATIKSFVGTCKGNDLNTSCVNEVYGTTTANHTGTLSDTKTDFSYANIASSQNLTGVTVSDSMTFTTSEATAFSNFLWGFTSGSGVAAQQIEFRNISMSFR